MKKNRKSSITIKSIIEIMILLAMFAGIISMLDYRAFSQTIYEQYEEGAFRIADAAAAVVDADRIDSFYESGGSSESYRETWKQLDQLCNASEATFIYVIRPDLSDYGTIFFVFSTVNRNTEYHPYEVGFRRTTTNDEYREKYRALYEGRSDRELLLLNSGKYRRSEHHITAMVPLKDNSGNTAAILCVQRQMNPMNLLQHRYVRAILLTLLVVTLVVAVGQSLFLHDVFIGPVKQIAEEATRFANENQPAEKKLTEKIQSNDEISMLAESIDQMEEQVQQYVENLTRITAEKEHIIAELSLAARIQQAILPHDFPPFPERHEFSLFASMKAAREVGGDFYDFFLIDSNHLCMVIADVSGKGIPAALFMMVTKTILQSCAMLGHSAADTLTKANEGICSNNQVDMFVTAWLGILEISTGKLTASNAGHEYPVLKRADGSFSLFKDAHSFVIGGLEKTEYREYELRMEPGDMLFVYTDGVPEATNEKNEMFGTERMVEALNGEADAEPEQLLETVRREAEQFAGDAEQFDDMTMLCMKYLGPDS